MRDHIGGMKRQMKPTKMSVSIPEFYSGKNIFLTGGTGFIGKLLIEKLLRCCPGIVKVYCLVRPKRGKNAKERFQDLFKTPAFDELRAQQPAFEDKVIAIDGDVLEDDLGIKEQDRRMLQDNVNIVFHSAATIKFNEHLSLAVKMNLVAVRKMIKLSRSFKNLDKFVHVSTAYTMSDQPDIEEIIYPTRIEPQQLIDIVELLDDEMIDLITPKLLGKKPNTYTYTKHLAECLLVTEGGDLPLAIVRPSIVTAAWKQPLRTGTGLLRSMLGDKEVVADIVPVDICVNAMIAVAWHTAGNNTENALVYHVTTGAVNPLTWGQMEVYMTAHFKKNPLTAGFRKPNTKILTKHGLIHSGWAFMTHWIPAYAADLGFWLVGKKPKMVEMYRRLHRSMDVLRFFTTHSWNWTHANLDVLKADMSKSDQEEFYFDPRDIDWASYNEGYCIGARKFVLKEAIPDMSEDTG